MLVTRHLILTAFFRYYYAIATFDSPNAAAHVYTELEGTELERSANLFDLSYVPEDINFDEKPHDEATHDAISYQPLDFTTDVRNFIYRPQPIPDNSVIGSAAFQRQTYMGRRRSRTRPCNAKKFEQEGD
jgi:hypothetical protein